jgi:glycosyltransferase involved in cell wall biosynthesis
MKKIWAHTLFKNEEKWLWYSVTSVIRHVDKLLLRDTGSTDRSWEIATFLKVKYPDKILLEKTSSESFDEASVRQEMLDKTDADWFIVIDADEIWWEESIIKVIQVINSNMGGTGKETESIIVPTINLVGDVFHFQEKSAGRYKFGSRVGHYNLRAVNRGIPGLRSQGPHGVWGWTDEAGRMIQDRNTYKFVDVPYLHATNLRRSPADTGVTKRAKKYKFELGEAFPKDFYYPEAFFKDRPAIVPSPWEAMSKSFKFRAFFETPLRKIKRRLWKGKVGY